MSQTLVTNRKSTLVDQARAIALILEAELSASVTLYDAESGDEIQIEGTVAPRAPEHDLTPEAVREFAARKRPVVTPLDESSYRVILPIKELGITRVVGCSTLPRASRDQRGSEVELPRLEKWCGLLLEKLSSTYERGKGHGDSRQRDGQARAVVAAFDVLLGNARLHADSARFQRYALKAITEVLGVEMAIWYGGDANPVVVARGVEAMSAWEARQLTDQLAARNDWDRAGVLIDNSVQQTDLAEKYPRISNLASIKVSLDGAYGYVIALNKVGQPGPLPDVSVLEFKQPAAANRVIELFARTDAALLTSFVTLVAAQCRTARRHQSLKDLVVGLTRSLTAAIDAKDSYTAGHSERVARTAVEIGKELGLPEEQLNDIYLAGLLHDIGKIGIRDDVLGKAGKLTDEEREHINQHVVIGHRILKGLTAIEHLLGGVLHHHEQFDGNGYPHKLKGTDIPPLARILAVADSFDAMSSDRPYRRGMSPEKVEEILHIGTGTQWDPTVVDAFFRCKERVYSVRQRGIGESLREALDGAMRQDAPQEELSLQFVPKKNPPSKPSE